MLRFKEHLRCSFLGEKVKLTKCSVTPAAIHANVVKYLLATPTPQVLELHGCKDYSAKDDAPLREGLMATPHAFRRGVQKWLAIFRNVADQEPMNDRYRDDWLKACELIGSKALYVLAAQLHDPTPQSTR